LGKAKEPGPRETLGSTVPRQNPTPAMVAGSQGTAVVRMLAVRQ
jgi:hypothetical protein